MFTEPPDVMRSLSFAPAVFIGDVVSFYADVLKVGNTSVTVEVEVFALRKYLRDLVKVTEATLTYVALGEDRKPTKINS